MKVVENNVWTIIMFKYFAIRNAFYYHYLKTKWKPALNVYTCKCSTAAFQNLIIQLRRSRKAFFYTTENQSPCINEPDMKVKHNDISHNVLIVSFQQKTLNRRIVDIILYSPFFRPGVCLSARLECVRSPTRSYSRMLVFVSICWMRS